MNTIINDNSNFINELKEKFAKLKKKKEIFHQTEALTNGINVSDKQKEILLYLANSRKSQVCLRVRSKIILLYFLLVNKASVAKVLDTYWNKVNTWVKRFVSAQDMLDRIEESEPHNLKKTIITILSDRYRRGKPPEFTSLQVASIIFVSLQLPEMFDIPISHWSSKALRDLVIKLKIVEDISVRQVSRYLKDMDINVYRYQGWLNSSEKNKDFEAFKSKIKEISDIYEKSEELADNGVIVTCTDEKMSIQALEHIHEKKLVKTGSLEKVEQEYKRQGVTGIIGTRNVVTGRIIVADIQPTRTELDFLEHIKQVVGENTYTKRILIMDQLNTHMSESLVKYIAKTCDINIDLGVKEKHGILKSKESRKEFLEDITHKIRILYTPKHTSWMNQIEIWFGILTKQLLNKRSSFKTVEELEKKIKEYIDYYNENLAKKFRWNSGKVLNA